MKGGGGRWICRSIPFCGTVKRQKGRFRTIGNMSFLRYTRCSDKNGAGYEKTDASTVISNMSVYGNLSRFSICVTEQEHGTELSVTMLQPCEGLSASGVQRAITAVADSISQYLENELVMNGIFMQKNR